MITETDKSLIHETVQTALEHRNYEPAHIDAQGFLVFTDRNKRQIEKAHALKQAATNEQRLIINWGTLDECPLPTPLQGYIYTDNPTTYEAIYREVASAVDHINATNFNVPFRYSPSVHQTVDHERKHVEALSTNAKKRGEKAQGYYGIEIVEVHFPHPDPRLPALAMLTLDTHIAPKGSVGLDTYKAMFEAPDNPSPSDLLELEFTF